MTSIDELMQRLEDDEATFTSAEVKAVVEHVERRALNDIYNKTRLIQRAENDARILEMVKASMDALICSKEPEKVVEIKVVSFNEP